MTKQTKGIESVVEEFGNEFNFSDDLDIEVANFLRQALTDYSTSLVEEIEKGKSNCKVYHNEFINSPDKIKVFNLGITVGQDIIRKRISK